MSTKTAVHELGHAHAERALDHGPKWGQACAEVGSMIALAMGGYPVD